MEVCDLGLIVPSDHIAVIHMGRRQLAVRNHVLTEAVHVSTRPCVYSKPHFPVLHSQPAKIYVTFIAFRKDLCYKKAPPFSLPLEAQVVRRWVGVPTRRICTCAFVELEGGEACTVFPRSNWHRCL